MKKREPIDLVSRLASRVDLNAPDPKAPESPPTTALRVAASPGPTVTPPAPAPRIVGREPPPRVEPSFERRSAGVVRPDVPRPEAPRSEPEPRPEAAAPVAEIVPPDLPAVAAEAPVADERADSTSRSVELNLVRLQKDGFVTPQSQRSLIAEEYRIIKRPLLRAAFDQTHDPNHLNHVVMITSARPGEGKTFTAINLAMSVATERDLHVLLVDCDIRRMGLSKKLGVADRKGLMDVLGDPKVTLSDVILRTNVPNLSVLPSGQPVEESTEVFASAKMTHLVDEIARRYPDRFIIFDAPPVLASSEPGVLAVHVGQTVMVVQANETSKRAIAQSIPLINGCPNVHFVLNRVTLAAGPDRFGYYGTY